MFGVLPFADIWEENQLMCGGTFSLSTPINGSNANSTFLSPYINPNCSYFSSLCSKSLQRKFWLVIFCSNQMASSKRISFMEQSSTSTVLNIKLNENVFVVIDPSKYSKSVQPLIVCLDHYVLMKALVIFEDVPISQLSLSYSTTSYNENMEIINFEVQGLKMSISKSNFCKLLGLPTTEDLIVPDKIFASSIIQVYQQMGYKSDLSFLSCF